MEPDFHRDYRSRHGHTNAGLVPGLILVGIGALLFLNNLHIIYMREWLAYWPVILIAIGIVKLVDSNSVDGRVGGGVLLGLGAVLLAQSLGYLQFRLRDMWPLILIGLGLLLLFQRAQWHVRLPNGPITVGPGFRASSASTADTVKIDAVFSGGKRVVKSQDFQGGEIVAVFGGIELDLRQAGIAADSAILEINAIFGGVEIRIPQDWSASVEGVGIFGGFADNTLQPDPRNPMVKRLVVRGAAIFGGVDVKN